jgi:hypothetical protein
MMLKVHAAESRTAARAYVEAMLGLQVWHTCTGRSWPPIHTRIPMRTDTTEGSKPGRTHDDA